MSGFEGSMDMIQKTSWDTAVSCFREALDGRQGLAWLHKGYVERVNLLGSVGIEGVLYRPGGRKLNSENNGSVSDLLMFFFVSEDIWVLPESMVLWVE